jgi:RNA polymerase sigma-70 factor (ECF subfamily)
MRRMDSTHQNAIRAVLAGNTQAYRALVVEHSSMVFRVAYRITQNEADAEEVVQETFLRGYQKLGLFQENAAFASWIYRIAVNCAYDLANRNQRDVGRKSAPIHDDDDDRAYNLAVDESADPERLLLSSELGAQQATAMQALTPLERAAFLLRHVEAQSTTEIAAALGVGQSAAKQAIFRAVQKLRLRLAAQIRPTNKGVRNSNSMKAENSGETR